MIQKNRLFIIESLPIFITALQILSMSTILVIWPMFAQAADMIGLRGQRYCEIFFSTTNQVIPKYVSVYSTIGLNDCPVELWNKITPEKIKKETAASMVHLNGPRYWVIDGLENSKLMNPTPKVLAGITMREAGVLRLDLSDILIKRNRQKPYRTHNVQRQTTWVYQAGKPVYELIDPEDKVYIMQSYSVQKTNQTEASLASLGSRLHLPEGWSFRTRILKKAAYLTPVDQKAVVIQDDFLNTYQQETPGF